MKINDIQDEIIEEFEGLTDWMDRYAYIIELGGQLPEIPESYKTPENLIEGCQSRVWIHAELNGDGEVVFEADSDAMIVKGIVALLLRVLSSQKPEDILESELYFIDSIGLKEHLSPTRSNGLVAMVKQMRMYALAFKTLKGN
ncbi:MAG: SufE family protein [Muribaculaceae bacterium]|jgi:cysteine desulfuration protein SufE|nr:SufE family protein [Muribaculaceae bacterium]